MLLPYHIAPSGHCSQLVESVAKLYVPIPQTTHLFSIRLSPLTQSLKDTSILNALSDSFEFRSISDKDVITFSCMFDPGSDTT